MFAHSLIIVEYNYSSNNARVLKKTEFFIMMVKSKFATNAIKDTPLKYTPDTASQVHNLPME